MNIGIVGLGLIGGSLAKSTKARTSHIVWGIDKDPETMQMARMCGAIDRALDDSNTGKCDIIMLALRPQAAIGWVKENAEIIAQNAIIIDMCGIKRTICEQLAPIAEKYGFSYIGGHPMAGKERGGFVNSSNDLFVGADMILTPDEHTDMVMLEKLKAYFIDIGFASLTFSTPDEHDRIIAYTSQLAHIASSAYIKSPEAQRRRGFSAGSFRDMTRVALLDENMWTELFMDNRDYLCEQLDILIEHLEQYREALNAGDSERVCELLRDGREKKASAGGN